jgi:hypothetical protein
MKRIGSKAFDISHDKPERYCIEGVPSGHVAILATFNLACGVGKGSYQGMPSQAAGNSRMWHHHGRTAPSGPRQQLKCASMPMVVLVGALPFETAKGGALAVRLE